MNTHTLWIAAIALCIAACSKQEPPEPQAPETDRAAAPAEEMQGTTPELDEAFISHMHEHAEKLDDLMFALSDGDLEGAATPAYWLSQHETVEGVPVDLRDYVMRMRNAAYDVETAEDLDTARAAAEEIWQACQECHTAAGVEIPE